MNGKRIKVLVAEDNPGDVFLIRRALDRRTLSYDLVIAKDGEEALQVIEAAAASQPAALDLVLLDLNLPKHDGGAILAAIRTQAPLRHLPVVILTSSDSPMDRARCMELGATHYFHKPSSLSAFMALGELAEKLVGDDAQG